jgi:hypothetical protein
MNIQVFTSNDKSQENNIRQVLERRIINSYTSIDDVTECLYVVHSKLPVLSTCHAPFPELL